jgi:hypothetical protein
MEGKMNIPERVRIGSMDYKVKLTGNVILKGNTQCYGHIDFDRHVIELDNSLQDTQGIEETFLHELVHGMINERNFNLKDADEEMIVDELAMGLHQIIRDNSEIFQAEKQ